MGFPPSRGRLLSRSYCKVDVNKMCACCPQKHKACKHHDHSHGNSDHAHSHGSSKHAKSKICDHHDHSHSRGKGNHAKTNEGGHHGHSHSHGSCIRDEPNHCDHGHAHAHGKCN